MKKPNKGDILETVSASAPYLGDLSSVQTLANEAGFSYSQISLSLVLSYLWLEAGVGVL